MKSDSKGMDTENCYKKTVRTRTDQVRLSIVDCRLFIDWGFGDMRLPSTADTRNQQSTINNSTIL
jgi:hypothetical protein